MQIPTHLKHKPILKLEAYNKIGGKYAEQQTDTQGLSVGLAQWHSKKNLNKTKIYRQKYGDKIKTKTNDQDNLKKFLCIALWIWRHWLSQPLLMPKKA